MSSNAVYTVEDVQGSVMLCFFCLYYKIWADSYDIFNHILHGGLFHLYFDNWMGAPVPMK